MELKVFYFSLVCFFSLNETLIAQNTDSTFHPRNEVHNGFSPYILPGGMFLSGSLLVMKQSPLHSLNTKTTTAFQNIFSGFHSNIDDWLQYVPGGGSLALGIAGVKGKHTTGGRLLRYAISSAIATGSVQAIKRWTHVLRPDGTTYNSFPSGHTATAFTGAEILHQEYGKRSVWYSVIGYSLASATGLMRMMNNRHSLADVLAGAGMGMASVRFSYWLVENMPGKRKRAKPISF